ncbi:MAG: murein L,D-transpeptidase, partial [Xanthobacteraceae bacterium]
MRNDSIGRHGFDRVLMAVAATFLTVSTSSAFAQTAPAQNNAAQLAIDAAVPVPDTSLVPPPTAADITATASSPATS